MPRKIPRRSLRNPPQDTNEYTMTLIMDCRDRKQDMLIRPMTYKQWLVADPVDTVRTKCGREFYHSQIGWDVTNELPMFIGDL